MPRPDNDQTGKRKLNFVGKKTYAISLPLEVVKILKWEKGDLLFVRRVGKKVIIEKPKKD